MNVWQVDFYRRPLHDATGHPLWELVIVKGDRSLFPPVFCSQADATPTWLVDQLQKIMHSSGETPTHIQAFRPQIIPLLTTTAQSLGIVVEPTRRTVALKQVLQERAILYRTMANYTAQPYEPVKLETPPPIPLPENLWGEQWRFAAIAAADLEPLFSNRPIPIRSMPASLLPLTLGIASPQLIPGVVIDGGRQSMRLVRWLQQVNPVSLHYLPGEPDGLLLEAGLSDRWVVATFTDREVIVAAQTFRSRQQDTQKLHFLLVQPDNSGMTYSGFWLLQSV